MIHKERKRRGPVRNRRNKAGETLTETLVAMLIVGLSSVLFLTMVSASGRIFQTAKKRFEEVYDVISKADVQSTAPGGSPGSLPDGLLGNAIGEITVTGTGGTPVKVNVLWYGDKEYVLSYKFSNVS